MIRFCYLAMTKPNAHSYCLGQHLGLLYTMVTHAILRAVGFPGITTPDMVLAYLMTVSAISKLPCGLLPFQSPAFLHPLVWMSGPPEALWLSGGQALLLRCCLSWLPA